MEPLLAEVPNQHLHPLTPLTHTYPHTPHPHTHTHPDARACAVCPQVRGASGLKRMQLLASESILRASRGWLRWSGDVRDMVTYAALMLRCKEYAQLQVCGCGVGWGGWGAACGVMGEERHRAHAALQGVRTAAGVWVWVCGVGRGGWGAAWGVMGEETCRTGRPCCAAR